jgi:hypothetical protein
MRNSVNKILETCAIVLVWLVLFDVGAQFLLKIVDNEKLNNFFSYGLSTETQIRNMFKEDIPDNSVLHAGWNEKDKFISRGISADVTFYGMSFSNHIADQLMTVDENLTIRLIDGPASPLNHSLSAFLIDKDVCRSQVAVLGVLDSSLKYLNAMTNDTIGSDSSMGSFYPRFELNESGLEQIKPKINSFEQLEKAINDKTFWDDNLSIIKEHDENYSGLIYKSNILDYSIMGRFLKRWYKGRHNDIVTKRVFSDEVFTEKIIDQASDMIDLFIHEAGENGVTPIILFIETQKYQNALSTGFKSYMDKLECPYLVTGDLVLTDNPANFKGDGHITEENNKKIAIELNHMVQDLLINQKKDS